MRVLTAGVLALALSSSSVMAGDAGTLAPGKPAGVKQAILEINPVYFIFGAVAVAIIAGVASTGGSSATAAAAGGSTVVVVSTSTSTG